VSVYEYGGAGTDFCLSTVVMKQDICDDDSGCNYCEKWARILKAVVTNVIREAVILQGTPNHPQVDITQP
jgi:hypothetical protein